MLEQPSLIFSNLHLLVLKSMDQPTWTRTMDHIYLTNPFSISEMTYLWQTLLVKINSKLDNKIKTPRKNLSLKNPMNLRVFVYTCICMFMYLHVHLHICIFDYSFICSFSFNFILFLNTHNH